MFCCKANIIIDIFFFIIIQYRSLEAFITDLGSLEASMPGMLAELGCKRAIEIYPKSVGQHGIGFAYSKNFSYGETISSMVGLMRDFGEFEEMKLKWYSSSPCQSVPNAEQFDWTYFSGILIIVLVTLVIGIVINSLEHVFVWLKRLYLERKVRNKLNL